MARWSTNPLVRAELSRFEEPPASAEGVVYRRFRDRASHHGRESLWVQFAVSGTNTWFGKRSEALRAEAEAIQTELPLFNRYHSAPGARERLAEYLTLQGREDLLLITADWIWGFGHRRPKHSDRPDWQSYLSSWQSYLAPYVSTWPRSLTDHDITPK